MSAMSTMIRKMFKEGDDKRDAGLTTPDDILRFDDIVYGADPKWQSLDVYRPKGTEGQKLPVIVSYHGGGWVYGDKERYQYYCMSLAQKGFAVVNFTYRLAPEFKFPAPMEDCNLVFTWVMNHAEEYGLDTNNIFAVGDSAGAHGLSLYAAAITNPAYAKSYDFTIPTGLHLNAIALNCGMAEVKLSKNPAEMTSALMADYLPGKGTPEEIHTVSIKYHVTPDYPPTFIMTATDDFLKMEAPQIAQVLAENNVPFILHLYGTDTQKLPHVFHCNMRSEDARKCNDEECAFFRAHLEDSK